MCFYHDDLATVYNQKVVKARKLRRCEECTDGVLPGEWYLRAKYLFEGEWSVHAICARCHWDHERVYLHELSVGCAPEESRCYVGFLQEHMIELARNEKWDRAQDKEDEEEIMDGPSVWDPSPITYRAAA